MGPTREVEGIGGTAKHYRQDCYVVLFHENGNEDVLRFRIDIPVATDDNWDESVGSLLGMDILSRYTVTVDYPHGEAVIDYADGKRPAPPLK